MVINEHKRALFIKKGSSLFRFASSITQFDFPSVPMQLKSEAQEVTSSSSPTGDMITKGVLNDFCPGGSS